MDLPFVGMNRRVAAAALLLVSAGCGGGEVTPSSDSTLGQFNLQPCSKLVGQPYEEFTKQGGCAVGNQIESFIVKNCVDGRRLAYGNHLHAWLPGPILDGALPEIDVQQCTYGRQDTTTKP